MIVENRQTAWNEIDKIFPYDYMKAEEESKNAGYTIYRSTADDHPENWISDMGNHLEINLENKKSVNIWIRQDQSNIPHHYIVSVKGERHDFEYTCSTIYEVLDAVMDGAESFGYEVKTTKLMIMLASMEQEDIRYLSTKGYSIRWAAGEV